MGALDPFVEFWAAVMVFAVFAAAVAGALSP